jgi:hypothetical protein
LTGAVAVTVIIKKPGANPTTSEFTTTNASVVVGYSVFQSKERKNAFKTQ